MTLNVDRAKQIIEEQKNPSKVGPLAFAVSHPNEILATILVGNNIVNILAAALSTTIATRIFEDNAVGIATGAVTIVILIFGEIIPKSFARAHAEKLSTPVLYILRFHYYALYPAVKLLVWIIHTVLGERAQLSARALTEGDIQYMINKAEREKVMDPKQLDLLTSILEFPHIKVKDIMVPRLEVRFLQMNSTFQQVMGQIDDRICSRYPVCDGSLDKTMGILHVKDLVLIRGVQKANFSLKKLLKEPFFVYEHMKLQAVFDYMNRKKIHLALVKNENGLVVGIVTLEDIIEEILGEIHDEHDIRAVKEEGTLEKEGVLFEGGTSLRDLYNEYNIEIPLNENYSTLSGFILDMLGNSFPKQGQTIVWEGLLFELCDVKDSKILMVKIKDANGKKHLFSKNLKKEGDEDSVVNGNE